MLPDSKAQRGSVSRATFQRPSSFCVQVHPGALARRRRGPRVRS
ncbi:hypothetical protein HMPREF0321_2678 [Dermacoccus sp. Ellin185]|nr:hypothetical protein HMPREF0321_2678 [Dermacoccus sp. Ellin185]